MYHAQSVDSESWRSVLVDAKQDDVQVEQHHSAHYQHVEVRAGQLHYPAGGREGGGDYSKNPSIN